MSRYNISDDHILLEVMKDQDVCLSEVTRHGFEGGVSGFIYHHEIKTVFDNYSNEFIAYIDEHDLIEVWFECIRKNGIQNMYDHLVWIVLEDIAANYDGICECKTCLEDLKEESDGN